MVPKFVKRPGERPKEEVMEPAKREEYVVGGKYRPIRILGQGGMGEVYEAEHIVTKRRVALKIITAAFAKKAPSMERRLFGEAETAASIPHPGIVDVLDAGREPDGTLYLALELLEGQDLENAIRRDRLRPADIVRVAVRLLDALAATHASGFVHRDIKPANVFLARSPYGSVQVKLLDFGIATRIDDVGDRGTVVGTVEYMSPEQAGSGDVGPKSDLWSVAAVIYRALAGRPPFLGVDFHKTLLRITTEDAPSLRVFRPDLPDDLIDVIDRALSRDPADRWASAEDMAQALALCDHASLYECENVTETADLNELMASRPGERLAPLPESEDIPIHVEATTAKYVVIPFAEDGDGEPKRSAANTPTLIVRRRERPLLRAS